MTAELLGTGDESLSPLLGGLGGGLSMFSDPKGLLRRSALVKRSALFAHAGTGGPEGVIGDFLRGDGGGIGGGDLGIGDGGGDGTDGGGGDRGGGGAGDGGVF